MTQTNPQAMLVRPLQVEVSSQSNPGESYVVTLAHCTCKDFRWRKGTNDRRTCKHIEEAYAIVAGWHGRPSEPQVFSGLSMRKAFLHLTDVDEGDLTITTANGLLLMAHAGGEAEHTREGGGYIKVGYDKNTRGYSVTLKV